MTQQTDQGGACFVWTSHAVPGGLQGLIAGGPYLGVPAGPQGRCSWVQPRPPHFSILLQRLAYGVTPESEHHLVAQRDVRQFQVGAAWNMSGGRPGEGPSCSLL